MEITAQNIHLSLGDKAILQSVQARAASGKITGVIGPNGSGKSTFLKCLYRVLCPDQGKIQIDGQDLDSLSLRESSRRLAVLAQHSPLSFDFTVEDLVLLGRAPHKKALERDSETDYKLVHASLAAVGLAGYEPRSVSTLSGGERQRVLLARALTQDTPILVLDEPTNHLDVKHQLQIMRICRESGKTVLAAIHDLNIAACYCDWIYALSEGRLCKEGPPSEVLTAPFIREIFEVEAEVSTDSTGRPRIFYLGEA